MAVTAFVLIAATALLGAGPGVESGPGDAALAERYLETLYGGNHQQLAAVTSEDLVFRDATATPTPGGVAADEAFPRSCPCS